MKTIRTCAVLLAAAFAIGTPIAQFNHAFGLSPAEFSSTGDSTLRAASYAFSIWGLIYAGLATFAVYQAVPRLAAPALLNRFAWPASISMAACGLWLFAAAADMRWMTVALILTGAISLLVPLSMQRMQAGARDTLFIIAPLSLLAGWLTLASVLNTLTVLTAEGIITSAMAPSASVAGIIVGAIVAAYIAIRSASPFYLIPVVWGLIAVYVAEEAHKPITAWLGLAAAGAFAIMALVLLRQNFRKQP